jgi:TolB protein
VRCCSALLWAVVLATLLGAAPLHAQAAEAPPPFAAPRSTDVAPPPTEEGSLEPAQDILIQGIGFSKLNLVLEPADDLPATPAVQKLARLLEKNLCWSGLFTLWGGASRYCSASAAPERIDMKLGLGEDGGALRLRLKDAGGGEGLVLFDDSLPLSAAENERAVIDLVNRLAERITGQPGILGSTIAFALRQPGYAKVIVATTTHGLPIQLISHNTEINILPRWSPGGGALVYTVLGDNGSRVYLHTLGAAGDAMGPSRFLTEAGSLNTGGAFSPDGKRLVFTMSPNLNADLFSYNLATRKLTQMTSRIGIETQADWSPDGKQMLFVSDRSSTPQIYLMDVDTREDLRLTFDGTYNTDPRFSPDGRLVLFTRRVDNVAQIFIMDTNGEHVRPVTRGRFESEQAEWSPDGRQIVFSSNRTGEFKLYVVATDGSALRRLTGTPDGFEETNATWTRRRMFR